MGEHRRGHLKIYFSYAAGTGKTCRMLRDARYAMEQGTDVAVGFAETWGRKQTAELLSGLPRIPFLELPGGWEPVREFNLDLTLKRKPDLVVVDDLAHTNVDGCRHNKRYQDVEELLQEAREAGLGHPAVSLLESRRTQLLPAAVLQRWLDPEAPGSYAGRLKEAGLSPEALRKFQEAMATLAGKAVAIHSVVALLEASRPG